MGVEEIQADLKAVAAELAGAEVVYRRACDNYEVAAERLSRAAEERDRLRARYDSTKCAFLRARAERELIEEIND